MKKKKLKQVLSIIAGLMIALAALTACSSSKNAEYQGGWKAQSGAGKSYTVDFKTKEFTIKEKNKSGVDRQSYEQKKKGVTTTGTKYYELEVDGDICLLIFPEKKDKNVAVLYEPDSEKNPFVGGKLLLALNKTKQPDYMDYAKKYLD